MNLPSQVSSLELSRRLKELGVRQDSLFYWWKLMAVDENYIIINPSIDNRTLQSYKNGYPTAEIISAYTTGELGEMLPDFVVKNKYKHHISAYLKDHLGHFMIEMRKMGEGADVIFSEDTEANARAAMLVYLIENDLIPKTNAAVFGGKEI